MVNDPRTQPRGDKMYIHNAPQTEPQSHPEPRGIFRAALQCREIPKPQCQVPRPRRQCRQPQPEPNAEYGEDRAMPSRAMPSKALGFDVKIYIHSNSDGGTNTGQLIKALGFDVKLDHHAVENLHREKLVYIYLRH